VAEDGRDGAAGDAQGQHPFVEAEDEAAFYGPKIDVQIWSAIGKEFSLATNQVTCAAERFDLKFINKQGVEEVPLCIHRAPLSTHERLIGFLIEHYGETSRCGCHPSRCGWCRSRTRRTSTRWDREATARAGHPRQRGRKRAAHERQDRSAQLMKIPYMLVVGRKR